MMIENRSNEDSDVYCITKNTQKNNDKKKPSIQLNIDLIEWISHTVVIDVIFRNVLWKVFRMLYLKWIK